MSYPLIVGIQRQDGTRIDAPDAFGVMRPIMLRLGPGLVGAPSWVNETETQVLIDAATQIRVDGNGLPYPVPVRRITLGDNLTAVSFDIQKETLVISSSGTGGGTGVPTGITNSVYSSDGSSNFWSTTPTVNGISTNWATFRSGAVSQLDHTIRQSNNYGQIVDYTQDTGGTVGSYAISAKPYDGSSSQAPRNAKFFGSFSLVGQYSAKILTFPTTIDGLLIPANTVLVGTFMFGWLGLQSSNPYNTGAITFLVTIYTDSTGSPVRLYTSLTGKTNYATQSTPYNFYLSPTMDGLVNGMNCQCGTTFPDPGPNGILPVGMSLVLEGSTFKIEFATMTAVGTTDQYKFYWEFSYGWGTS